MELVRVIKDLIGHRLCGRDTYWANLVLTKGLSERLPLVYRWGIANLFEEVFFSVCGDGEKPVSTLCLTTCGAGSRRDRLSHPPASV